MNLLQQKIIVTFLKKYIQLRMTTDLSLFLAERTIQLKTINGDEQSEIEEKKKVLKIQRESCSQEVMANLRKIDADVHELKKTISLDIQNVQLHFFKDFIKGISKEIDSNDNILNCRYKELLEQEKVLSQTLKEVEKALLDVNLASCWTKPHSKTLDTHHVNLPEDVSKFDVFLLKHGGHSGGWKPEDHQLFLQLKSEHMLEQTAELLNHKLPDISTEQVIQHNAWYKEYSQLLHNKKQAVESWKKSKRSESLQSLKCTQDTNRMNSPGSSRSTGRKTSRTDEEIKMQISQWKLQKSLALQEEQKIQKQREERKLMVVRERQEIKMMEKQKVADYLSQKRVTQLHQKTELERQRAEEKKNKALKANIMIQLYRKQDAARFQEKLDRKKKVAQSRLQTQERLSRVKCRVKNIRRDPRRVMKPTAVWKNRISEESGKDESTDVGFITQVPHLKVPDWRHNVLFQDQITL